jgi:hypothetical protein
LVRCLFLLDSLFLCVAYAAEASFDKKGLLEAVQRKCLKVEYLGRIEYDFQKSRVTGPWDHKVSVSCLCTFNYAMGRAIKSSFKTGLQTSL